MNKIPGDFVRVTADHTWAIKDHPSLYDIAKSRPEEYLEHGLYGTCLAVEGHIEAPLVYVLFATEGPLWVPHECLEVVYRNGVE